MPQRGPEIFQQPPADRPSTSGAPPRDHEPRTTWYVVPSHFSSICRRFFSVRVSIPFPSSFRLGRNPILSPQVSFGVRTAGAYIRGRAVFFWEIFGGPAVFPRACGRGGASLHGIAWIFGVPAAHPPGSLASGESVCCSFTISIVSFQIEFLIPFPSSFCLGRNPTYPSPRRSPSFLAFDRPGACIRGWPLFFSEIYVGLRPRAILPGGQPPRDGAEYSAARRGIMGPGGVCALPRDCWPGGRGVHGTSFLRIYPSFFSIPVSNTLSSFFCLGRNPILPRAGFLHFWCSTGRGRASTSGRCFSARSSAGVFFHGLVGRMASLQGIAGSLAGEPPRDRIAQDLQRVGCVPPPGSMAGGGSVRDRWSVGARYVVPSHLSNFLL